MNGLLWIVLLGVGTIFLTGDFLLGAVVVIIASMVFRIKRKKGMI